MFTHIAPFNNVQILLIIDKSCVQNLKSGSLLVYKKLTCTNLSSRYGNADFFIDKFQYFILKIIIVSGKNSILQLRDFFFITCLVAKCILSSVPLNFHKFLLRTFEVYEKSFYLKKKRSSRFIKKQWKYSAMKLLLNCSTNLTTSVKKICRWFVD